MTSMRRRRVAAVAVIGIALVAGPLIAAGSAVATTTSPSCAVQHDDPWPAWVQERPAGINPKTTAAIYMWHDSNGWNIRVTHHTTNLRTFSGELTSSGLFTDVRPVKLEKSDTFAVSKDKHDITFLFKNYGYIDGLNFYTHCAPSIDFAFQSDGKTSPANKIIIGKDKTNPSSDPFMILRMNTSTTTTSTTMPSTTTISTTTTSTSTTTMPTTTTTMPSTTTSTSTTTTSTMPSTTTTTTT